MQKPIVIFDSGVGGLSIFKEVISRLPHLPVVYCSDNEGFPYGPKSENEVVERTLYCLNRLSERFQPSLAVIACNTASTISLPRARTELNIPVVGVVPAIKPAAIASRKHCIGLLATPGTVERAYTHQLIKDFAQHCEVIRVGSSALVDMAEQYLRSKEIDLQILKETMTPFFDREVSPDCIVLGCTHFPLLKDQLEKVVSEPIHWIDSGEAIARRVESLLEDHPQSQEKPAHLFTHTGSNQTIIDLEPALMGMGFTAIDAL